MKVVTQKGENVTVSEVEMCNNVIVGILKKDTVILGIYSSLSRACDVMADLTTCSWNGSEQEYMMPEK